MKRIEWHAGDVIMKYRAIRGWTRAILARRAGLSAVWMGRIERTGICPEHTLRRVAEALGTTADEIRAHIPLKTDEVVCRKHLDIFKKADRVVHEGSAFAGVLMVILDAAIFAHNHGFSATESLKGHLEKGTIPFIDIERSIEKTMKGAEKRRRDK